ncbi:serine/arginine repetitive matrix protein 4 isoform X2 [Syngnathoides biaculeatus]|uniref:serine/arginine repetitive matrix protein 4 isoform X2 n=1 Tax=Syngnathoides biaculeatus TaxID=300417 RepID=UPI002ADE5772|nr:serine/arginine repetitive matrix protein 4 isoform X2 [Syngnathoides biaculeatus]
MMRTAPVAAESLENAATLHQKQLFEKFWKGTFKAVATPRPESVIVASIIARTRLPRPEAKADRTPGDHQMEDTPPDPKPCDDSNTRKGAAADSAAPPIGRKKHKRHRHHRHRRRAESASFDEESPSLKAKKKKKKKRKSERKSSRRRVPSCSLSPLRKRKKKKKKMKKRSKKNKRHRYTSKKSKHGSRTTSSRGKRRRGRSASDRPPATDRRQPAYKKETRPTSEAKWTSGGSGGAAKSVKTPSVLRAASMFSPELFRRRAFRRAQRSHDCDSGNDTSSPPSGKSSVSDGPRPLADDASDSGNSLRSYASGVEDDSSASAFLTREHEALGYRFNPARSPRTSSRGQPRNDCRHRRGRSRSSGSSRYTGQHSPSSSPSTASSYSRSTSFSPDLRRRRGRLSSVSSRGSYSKYRQRRLRSRERASSSRETEERRVGRKRWRRKSYSPMRKRRRYSPSHLEARRITSARKRPVPYLRRSSSSRSSSRGGFSRASSWSFGAARRSVSRC